jgi:hypothetical protein
LIVLVGFGRSEALLRKEKDEASPPGSFSGRLVEFTSIPRLRSLEVFYFQKSPGLALVSQLKPFREKFSRNQNGKIST